MSASSVSGRYARLLQILHHLQSGGGLNADDLAGQLEVCRRTIFRDLSLMRAAGIEICFDEKVDCYRLQPRRDLVVMPTLEHEELTTLVAAVHLSVLRHLPGCSDLLRQSTNKLLAQSPYQVQHHAIRLINSCSIRPIADRGFAQVAQVMDHILQAICQRRILRLTLVEAKKKKEITTRFAPYQVIATTEAWQVVGRSSHHRSVRTLDPCNIRRTQMTDEIYAIPPRFQSRD